MAHLYVFNQHEQLLMILSEEEFESDEHKRQLNGSWTFTFTTESKYASVLLKSHKVAFYDREGNFRLFVISEVPTLTYHDDRIEVYSVNDYFRLSNQIVEDKRLRDGTAREALSKVLEGSEYLIGEVADLGSQTISFYDVTRMEGLESIVEAYGGEIDFRIELDEEKRCISKKYIDLKARLGTDTGLRFTFDSNLEEIKRSDASEGHFTVLYGRGKGVESGDGYSRKIKFTNIEWTSPTNPVNKPMGQSFIEDQEAITKWGRIEGIYENSNIEDPEELLRATYEALQQVKNPVISYEVKATDLSHQNGYEHFKITLGDSVILLDEPYQLSLESRIVEISESIKDDEMEQYLTLGSVQSSLTDSMGNAQITTPSEGTNDDIEIGDSSFPNELPTVPQLRVEGLFSAIVLEWTYENKSYYEYEVYASPLENFNPDSSNLIFRGKASSFLHQVKPKETWYYRVRAINTHGRTTDFSSQAQASTLKIEDGTDYFEKAAIADALIGELRLDRGWVGKLKGDQIDARKLSVTDGNGKKTVDIDSFGNISLDVLKLMIKTFNGAYTVFDNSGMNSFNNIGQQTLGIRNGGITFHPYNTNQLGAYITQSALWGGNASANGLAISTANNGTYIALGTSSLADANTTLNMEQALTISASDGFQPRGINFWKDVHAHGYGIRQLSHLHLAGSGAIQFDYLNTSPSTIYEAVGSGHSLYVMGGYQTHIGCMDGKGVPKGVIWMQNSTSTHSYAHWDFHNYTMRNMKTATTYSNAITRRSAESYGVTSNVEGIRYLYRDIELIDGKAVRNLPNEYKGCTYDIVSIVCKGRGQAWVESEEDNRFEIQGDCLSVNVEIIIYPVENVMMFSSVHPTEAPVLELPEEVIPEVAQPITNEGVNSCDFWNQYMYSKYLVNLKKVAQMSGL